LRADEEGAPNRQLLLLTSGKVAASAAQRLPQHREKSEDLVWQPAFARWQWSNAGREVLENSRPLKVSADAEVGDLSLVEATQVSRALKEDLARIWPGLAGDHIHHRRLAGAVRTDDRA
jgi:hypothetical protein